ncbi:hypothetical protein C882_1568 [Caenispirillum salinarum AK4]|uniref:HPr-rel-A system PqqD family protein n=1 Tax=Caenispirillum salinarum AK4 TaxID=1238182 RepID=K9HX46_9PROT|nr:HPr-rel-A system PqqD family peptide chaperone [Caenispirillum salinarum]EKV32731.1 hypothetical protein C882_1568 [Caenispirillum salinarum AK4]
MTASDETAPDLRATPAPRLLWRRWEDGAVVYREDRGETHFLDPATAAVLVRLCESPVPPSPDDLLAAMRAATAAGGGGDGDGDAGTARHLARILDRLARAGLVQRHTLADAPAP